MVRKWISILNSILLILSTLCFSSFLVGATPAIGSTTVTLQSIADAYVNASSTETNYGSSDSLYISANSKLDFTYVMFDLSSLPPEANILSAYLNMYLLSTGGDIYTGDDYGAHYCSDNSWTEHGITWNNKPSFVSEPTYTLAFGFWYTVKDYKSWDVTADVRNAFSSGFLTEVLKFEDKTGDGYAVFRSKEDTQKPRLKVEYSTKPVFKVHFESTQDTGVTNNLGLTTIADYIFPFPSDNDVVAGDYQVIYSAGYTFLMWETSGGVTVSNPNDAITTITVSGDGTLRAVGNVDQLEYAYDREQREGGLLQETGDINAVRFTPLFTNQLLKARFYISKISSYRSETFKVHIMDENRNDLITPFEQTPTSVGWFDVDLSSFEIEVNEGIDFYIGMEWMTDYNPVLGGYNVNPSHRSWEWNGTSWLQKTYNFFIEEGHTDCMIRAVVGKNGQTIAEPMIIHHMIVADGIDFQVTTKSNSTISNCQFNKDDKELSFDVAGTASSYGFCNVTIPNELLGGPFSVTSDEQTIGEVLSSSNSTHTWLHFIYPQTTSSIEITGNTVIPEFSSAIILTLFTSLAIIAVALAKKNVVH